jgi:hypothetical protein
MARGGGALGEKGVGWAVAALFDGAAERFAVFRREFVRLDDQVQVVYIGDQGHRSDSL